MFIGIAICYMYNAYDKNREQKIIELCGFYWIWTTKFVTVYICMLFKTKTVFLARALFLRFFAQDTVMYCKSFCSWNVGPQ